MSNGAFGGISNKKIVIACDLFLDLKLYHLPKSMQKDLEAEHSNCEIREINTPNTLLSRTDDIEVYWGNRITPETIERLPNLKWIHFGSIGVNRANCKAVIDRNILVTNSRGTMEAAVAVTAFGFITALARGFHHCWNLRTRGDLSRESFDTYFNQTSDLEHQTCLIVGLGEIGTRVAKLCNAAGMKVTGVKKQLVSKPKDVSEVYPLNKLSEAVADADFVVNLLPYTDETASVFNEQIFNSMKPSTFFINVGRGETVNETCLIAALKSNVIAGAALDVFAREPLSESSELWGLKNTIITPHIACVSTRYWAREKQLFSSNLLKFRTGKELDNRVKMSLGSF